MSGLKGESGVALGWRRWIPRSYQELLALLLAIGVLVTASGWAARKLFPTRTPLSWQERVDAVCLRFGPRIAEAARLSTQHDQVLAQANLEADFVADLERLSSAVPIEQQVNYSQLVRDHRGIVYWRRIVARRWSDISALPSAPQLRNLEHVESAALVDAKILGLGVCGQIDSRFQ